jgi:hypothetical protein
VKCRPTCRSTPNEDEAAENGAAFAGQRVLVKQVARGVGLGMTLKRCVAPVGFSKGHKAFRMGVIFPPKNRDPPIRPQETVVDQRTG